MEAAAAVIEQLKRTNDTVKIRTELQPQEVSVALPAIVSHMYKLYRQELKDGAFELELRIGTFDSHRFVPGVSEACFSKVRSRLQKHKGWFLGFDANTAVPKIGVPRSKLFRTLVFEEKKRVRVPFVHGTPLYQDAEVIKKTSICSVTFHLTGESVGFRLGVAGEKPIQAQREAMIAAAQGILSPKVEKLHDKLRYGRDVSLRGPLTLSGAAKLFVAQSAYSLPGAEDEVVTWMKTEGGGKLPPAIANQISWTVMNSQFGLHATGGGAVQVLDEPVGKLIVACSSAGKLLLPGSSKPIIFPEGRYVITAPAKYFAAGRRRGGAMNQGLVCVREQRRTSFVYAKPPRYIPIWQVDASVTMQSEGVQGLASASPVYELELEAGRGIDGAGTRLVLQLSDMLFHNETLKRVLSAPSTSRKRKATAVAAPPDKR